MAGSAPKDEVESILNSYFTVNIGARWGDDIKKQLREFQVRDDDVFLLGQSKTGTTWAQEMVWLIANDLDFEGAKQNIDERFPVMELFSFYGSLPSGEQKPAPCYCDSLEFIKRQNSPRFIKTHVPVRYLPNQIQEHSTKAKIIYITRAPSDTCVSMYYFMKNLLKIYTGNLEDFCKVFMAGRVGLGPFWDHVKYFWNRRDEENVLFIRYEEMKTNLPGVVQDVALFFGKTLSPEQATALIECLDFDSMKNNPAVNHTELYKESGFIREGKVGSAEREMSEEMLDRFRSWTNACLQGTSLLQYYCPEDR